MQLTLHLEQGAMAGEARTVLGDRYTIGRAAENDWALTDPDKRLSRQHCIIERRGDGFTVKDVSKNGILINDEMTPLGHGRERRLQDGDRLEIGPYVLRIDLQGDRQETPMPTPDENRLFDPTSIPTPAPKEGAGRIFDKTWYGKQEPQRADHRPTNRRPKLDKRFQVDPDHRPMKIDTLETESEPPRPKGAPLFDEPGLDRPVSPEPPPAPTQEDRSKFLDDPFAEIADAQGAVERVEPAAAENRPPRPPIEPPPQDAPAPDAMPAASPDDQELIEAFLEGAGLSPEELDVVDRQAFMRDAGARFADLVTGLAQLLRARSTVKTAARIERTMLGADRNNPLKFADSVDDALLSVLTAPRPGFMDSEAAIQSSFRDLQEHEMALLDAMQVAVRALMRHFDPETFEHRLEAENVLTKLVAGGRHAMCWKMFKEHYGDIADDAEREFLGAVSRDFAKAYEKSLRRR